MSAGVASEDDRSTGRSTSLVDVVMHLEKEVCLDRWQKRFGIAPPAGVSLVLMRKVLAYEAQIKKHGGHSSPVRRTLKAALKAAPSSSENYKRNATKPTADVNNGDIDHGSVRGHSPDIGTTGSYSSFSHLEPKIAKPSSLMLRAGTHLVREWNGRTYQVEVLDDGFAMDGKRYRSLSAIARKITGAHWSGPRFFGLGGS